MVDLIVHVAPGAPASRAVLWALARKGLAARVVEVAPTAKLVEDVGAPLLEVGGVPVAGLRPIAFRLERLRPDPSFFPAESRRRNQAGTLAEFAECVIAPLVARAEGDPAADLAGLDSALLQIRDAIRHGALDRGEAHLGDIAVAAMIVSAAAIPGLRFERDWADLAAYAERIRALCGGVTSRIHRHLRRGS